MPTLTVQIATEKIDTADLKKPSQNRENLRRIADYIEKIGSGKINASVEILDSATAPVAASGTFTLVSAVATDAVTIGQETFTASSTPSGENEWEIDGADDTADAAALAAAINAHSTIGKLITATSALGVVTMTCNLKGSYGNQIPISSADATITASGAFLASGAGGPEDAAEAFSKT